MGAPTIQIVWGLLAAFQYCTHVAIENCTLGALT